MIESRSVTVLCFPETVCCDIRLFFFFFQAEDGIRDLVRSRGLGDVYKRQAEHGADASGAVGAAGVKIRITHRRGSLAWPARPATSQSRYALAAGGVKGGAALLSLAGLFQLESAWRRRYNTAAQGPGFGAWRMRGLRRRVPGPARRGGRAVKNARCWLAVFGAAAVLIAAGCGGGDSDDYTAAKLPLDVAPPSVPAIDFPCSGAFVPEQGGDILLMVPALWFSGAKLRFRAGGGEWNEAAVLERLPSVGASSAFIWHTALDLSLIHISEPTRPY